MNAIAFAKGRVTGTRRRFASFLPASSRTSWLIIVRAIGALSLCLSAATAEAEEEPPLPSNTETPSPTPSPANTRPQLNIPEIPPFIEPPTLVPNASVTPSGGRVGISTAKTAPLSQLDSAFQQSPLGQAAEEQRLHLEWRKLQNRVVEDPEVVAAKAATTRTKTDLEKRVRLRSYYNIYYAHMQALTSDPQIKAYLEGKKTAALEGLAQHRVRSTPTPKPKGEKRH
jgi:hypothetical protein